MFTKAIYEHYREAIHNHTITPNDIKVMVNDCMFALKSRYQDSGIEATEKELKELRVFSNLFKKIRQNPNSYDDAENLLFEVGRFEGVIQFCDTILSAGAVLSREFSSKDVEYDATRVKFFLLDNPDSKVENICANTYLKKESVEQVLFELEGMGIVESFGCGENTAYALSVSAVQEVKRAKRVGCLFDGYVGEPIFKAPTTSTYYDYETDKQCTIPLRSREELKKELGLD